MVITNVPLNLEAIEAFIGRPIAGLVVQLDEDEIGRVPFSDIKDFSDYDGWRSEGKKGNGPLFVIDECHEAFAQCTGLKAEEHPIVDWMAKHRHLGADVLIMTQDAMGIPAAIRRRCEFVYEFRSLKALGFPSRYAKLTFVKRNPHAIDRTYGKYRKEWYGLYKSHGLGVAEKISKPKNILLNWRMLLVLGGIPVALFFAFKDGIPGMPGADAVSTSASAEGAASVKVKSSIDSAEKALGNIASIGGAPPEMSTPAIDDVREKIALLRLNAELQALQAAPLVEGGELVPNGEGGLRYRSAEPRKRHDYDGAKVRIVGHMMANAQHTYWLEVERDHRKLVQRDDDLVPFGFTLTAISPCVAFLKGDHGSYRLTCDGQNVIGAAPVEESAASVVHEGTSWVAPEIKSP